MPPLILVITCVLINSVMMRTKESVKVAYYSVCVCVCVCVCDFFRLLWSKEVWLQEDSTLTARSGENQFYLKTCSSLISVSEIYPFLSLPFFYLIACCIKKFIQSSHI